MRTVLQVRPLIVNYNGYEDTIACLNSLKEQSGLSGTDCRPLVIDNASMNASVEHIRSAHPDVQLEVMDSNLGFSGGNNVAIKMALDEGCDYLFLVNNDTEMEPDCLDQLLQCAISHPEAAVISPAMYYHYDRNLPWFTGSKLDIRSANAEHTQEDVRAGRQRDPYEIPWSTGCAMLISAQHMQEIRGFNERFFCYWEDINGSLRARKRNYKCLLCPTAILYHKVGATSGATPGTVSLTHLYYETRNRMLCMANNLEAQERRRVLTMLTRRALLETAYKLRHWRVEGRRRAFAVFMGAVDFHRRRFGRCTYTWLSPPRPTNI